MYIYARIWISHCTNTLDKGVNSTIIPSAMDKLSGRLAFIILVCQPVNEKKTTWKIDLVSDPACVEELDIYIYIYICIHIYIKGSLNKFSDFFVWALLFIVHTWNSSPLRSNLLQPQCTCCTVPTTSGRPHGSPLVWACQWLSSQLLSYPQLSHNDSL